MNEPDQRVKCFRYSLGEGWEAVAGRQDWDNEQLSLKYAGPNDYWFHAKAVPGSHVILHNTQHPGAEAPVHMLEQAAAIALYHSKAKHAGRAAVNCTQAKHVGKPRGAKTGTVSIRRDRTIKARPGVPNEDTEA
jgi:predicted ribosome quality control (RQC) complex YloA/Tae2 family protein